MSSFVWIKCCLCWEWFSTLHAREIPSWKFENKKTYIKLSEVKAVSRRLSRRFWSVEALGGLKRENIDSDSLSDSRPNRSLLISLFLFRKDHPRDQLNRDSFKCKIDYQGGTDRVWSDLLSCWALICLRSAPGSSNCLPQILHWVALASSWWFAFIWYWRATFWINPFPQTSHLKGVSPVWIRWCRFIFEYCLNAFPQSGHSNSASIFEFWCFSAICSRYSFAEGNLSLHNGQVRSIQDSRITDAENVFKSMNWSYRCLWRILETQGVSDRFGMLVTNRVARLDSVLTPGKMQKTKFQKSD